MKTLKYSGIIAIAGHLLIYLFCIIALLHFGSPLWLHDPKELFGIEILYAITFFSLLSLPAAIISIIVWCILLFKKKIKLLSTGTLYAIIVIVVFLSQYINLFDYWLFWFYD